MARGEDNLDTLPPDPALQRFDSLSAYARAERLPWRRLADGRVGEIRALEAFPEGEREAFPLRAAAHVPRRRFEKALQARFRDDLVDASLSRLRDAEPAASAFRLLSGGQKTIGAVLLLAAAAYLAIAPLAALITFNALATVYFLFAIAFRLMLTIVSLRTPSVAPVAPPLKDGDLPVVTILLPVHDEVDGLASLAASIADLDYPRDKLDVKLLVEENDGATLAEARRLGLDNEFDLVIVPRSTPQTKPKACNHGLQLARGSLTVIYDAEDAPEPDQLRKAAAAFAAADDRLACLQARLNYYNADENWLTRGIMAQTPPRAAYMAARELPI